MSAALTGYGRRPGPYESALRGGRWLALLLCALLALAWDAPADARKVALVIGNSAYFNTSSLTNPANDTALVANAARRAGFDVVSAANLSVAGFQQTLRDFRAKADGADAAMIYYAGHGIEGQGKNWLIPVDAKLETDFDLPYEAINLDRLFEALVGARVRIIVLDACRNNPFGSAWRAGIRGVPRGLGQIEVDDVLVIYAAAPGQTASDGTGVNSPFAESLARRLPEPGLPVQLLGGAVRDDVLAATGGKQRPFVSASITGTPVYLVSQPQAASSQAAAAAPVAPPPGDRTALDALMWQGALSANTAAGYQAYMREFPTGIFTNLARENMARLQAPAPAPRPVASRDPQPGAEPPPVQASSGESAAAATTRPPPPSDSPGAPPAEERPVQSYVYTAPLPTMPATPQFSSQGYPDCRESFQAIADTLAKVEAINRCTVQIDQFYRSEMTTFRRSMIDHQNLISKIYTEQVANQTRYSPASQEQFFSAMMGEHAASNPDGSHFAEFRATEARYRDDRTYLQDRYCAYAGCPGGAPNPPGQ